jgi:two-component system NarL family sensor kinase
MRKYSLLILSVLWFGALHAQLLNKDSLLRLLPIAKEDSNKIHLLFFLADQYETSEPDKAKQYTRMAGELSQKLNFESGIMKCNRYLAFISAYQGQYDSMLHYSQIVLDIATQKKDTFNIGVSLFNIGEAYKFKSDYENGIQYTLEAVNMLQDKGYTNIESNLYGGLQGTYLMLKQYDKAISYGLKAIELGRKLKDKTPMLSAMVNLANCYGEVEKFKEAKEFYREAIILASGVNNKSVEAMSYEGLIDLALKENQYELVKQYADKALALHSEIQHGYGLTASHQALAIYYLTQKDFAIAEDHAQQALQIARKESYLEGEAEVLNTLSAIAFAAHNFDSAFKYGDESQKITEKVFTESVAEKDAQMRVKYETEKKDTQLKLQQVTIRQKNTLNYIFIGSAAAFLIIALLSYRNHKHNQKLQQQRITELETEKKLTATEAVLKGEEQERTRLAKDLHDGLGGMLSGIKYSFQSMKGNLIMTPDNAQAFERSMDMLDSSIKEMRRVAHNMMPEALVKFGLDTALKDFCNDINKSGALQVSYQSIGLDNVTIEQTTGITIFRVVQELINNTMKHAAAKNAIVQVTKSDDTILVTVEDNGKGFDTRILQQSQGMGWTNIRSRVDYLKGKLDVRSEPGKGTSVLIELNT